MMNRLWCLALASIFAVIANATPLAAADNVLVRVGTPNVASDAPLFVAVEKGFFAKQGINVQFVGFASAADMVAPLGTGQLDVGAGGLSAGLFNAVARGVAIKAVADKVSLHAGSHYLNLVVRKDLLDSGRFKSLKDLKGLRIGEAGIETSTSYALSVAAKQGGLTYNDFEHPSLSFPDQFAALQNKSIDASVAAEPILTRILDSGVAGEVKSLAQISPNLQVAVLLYSESFSKNSDVAQRFMNAYIQGARYYADAIRNGKLVGPNAAEVIPILIKYTTLKDPAIYRRIAAAEIDPNGRMNMDCLRDMLRFFEAQGYVKEKVTVGDLVNTSFIDRAVKTLGPYRAAR